MKVIVVGAGVAGMAAAIRLAVAGAEVEIYEKLDKPGGKMNVIEGNGYRFDLGPTIVMMPEVYREVFEVAGRNPDDYIPMTELNPIYSLQFNEQETLKVSADMSSFTKLLEDISFQDAEGYYKYIADTYKKYVIAKDYFIEKSFNSALDFYNPKTLIKALQLKTLDSAHHTISKYVKDHRLQKMLSFQTLYIGISPYVAPSIYTIIPMIEMIYGVWFIKGGMYKMVEAMAKLCAELGVKINLNSAVEEIVIENSTAKGIMVNGEVLHADQVLCNADFPYAIKNLISEASVKGKYNDRKIDSMEYSCSCLLYYFGLDKKLSLEDVHNIIFSQDFDGNISDIFEGRLPEDPSMYFYIPSKLDASLAPEGGETLYVLVPVPNLKVGGELYSEENLANYKAKIMDKMKKVKGLEDFEEHIKFESVVTPVDFEEKLSAANGATFGLAPTLLQSNYFRPQTKALKCKGLYFTGSSVHPGAGVPIALTSAKLVAADMLKDATK